MQKVLHETCEQYVARRLSEGWRIINQTGFNVILQSPEGIIRPVDLRNDAETLRPNAVGDYTNIAEQNPTGVSSVDKFPTTKTTQSVNPEDDDDWLDIANIGADDAAYASITATTYDANDISYQAKAQGFGFAIPDGATLSGIQVDIERKCSAGSAVDYRVQLLNAVGALVGDNKADTVNAWPASDAVKSYGGATDTWNATPTVAMVNDANFGVVLSAKATGANTDIYVDYIKITITYVTTFHWDKVDEASADNATTYVQQGATATVADAYNLGDTAIPSNATINSVTVYFRCLKNSASALFRPGLRLGTSETLGTQVSDTYDGTWKTYSEVLARPGGGSWAVSNLNALQVIIQLQSVDDYVCRCTQVYVEVDYTAGVTFIPTVIII